MIIFFIIMETNKVLALLEFVQELRDWSKDNFPISDSIIASNLLIFLAIEFSKNNQLTVKQLFAGFPYSYTATRQHYNHLLNHGWISHENHHGDARVKYIRPSSKFMKLINSYTHQIENSITRIHINHSQRAREHKSKN